MYVDCHMVKSSPPGYYPIELEHDLVERQKQSGEEVKPVLEKLLLTVSEASEMCGWSRSNMYNQINRGALPVIRVGRSVRIPKEWLVKWINEKVEKWQVVWGIK